MRRTKQAIAVLILLCVTPANTEVLRAIHLHLHHVCSNKPVASRNAEKRPPLAHRDSDNCPYCIQFASPKTVPLAVAGHILLAINPTETPVLLETTRASTTFPPSSSPRAPPLLSL